MDTEGAERTLIDRARKGDKDAFLLLYEQYFDRVFKFIFYKVSHQEEAEDIAQETFLKALKGIENFRGESKFVSWLFQIAKFTIMDYFRQKYRYPTVELQDYLAHDEASFILEDNPENPFPEKVLEKEQLLKSILQKLPANYRTVIECRFLQNLSLKETADTMKTTVGNVKILQYRALQKASQLAQHE